MDNLFTRIYALLVCFVSVICLTISTGMGLYEIVKIIDPELTLSPQQYQHLSSSNHYQFSHQTGVSSALMINPYGRPQPSGATDKKVYSDEQLTEMRAIEFATILENERRSAIASLIRIIIILVVSGPVFYIHWRLAERYERPA